MKHTILKMIASPDDVKKLSSEECKQLCEELRAFLLDSVSETGGHLASNLGAVELTVAIHRVFDTARDRLVFDVGHQCYVHKALTGRQALFSMLRSFGGMSGFPKPYESVHDAFVAGHASNSVSVALGMARARTLQGADYRVLALIGDGALTGGLAYEGLNNAGASQEPLIILLNDNGMSIGQNVGGVASHLARIRTRPGYYQFKKCYHNMMHHLPGGRAVYHGVHRVKTSVKKALWPCSFFEDMGLQYLGPVDGHDLDQLCHVLNWAKELRAPVVVHVNTVKGKGYSFAEENPDRFHGVAPFNPQTGMVLKPSGENFSKVAGKTLCDLARQDARICTITAAMESGTGLDLFAKDYPERFFDVGIAEGHAVAMAAGMAAQGMVPVFAVYSSFLQRGFDMLLHDVGLMQLHVVFAVDRAGLVGEDGETHHGVFDVGYLSQLPGIRIYCPASFAEMRAMLERAVLEDSGPVAVRYARGGEGAYKGLSCGASECCREGKDFTLVSYGVLFNELLTAADLLEEKGISAEIIKLNTIVPLDVDAVAASVEKTGGFLVLEDCVENGSVGQRLTAELAKQNALPRTILLKNLGNAYTAQGSVSLLRKAKALDGASVAAAVEEALGHGEKAT